MELERLNPERSYSYSNFVPPLFHSEQKRQLSWKGDPLNPLYGVYMPGICGHKGYGFLATLVINRVSILVILISDRVWFFAFGFSCL